MSSKSSALPSDNNLAGTLPDKPGRDERSPVDFDRIDLELGKRLKTFRIQAEKTQADIAAHLEISPQQYQKYEKGTSRCNIANIYKLANYYQRPISDLLPGATPPPASGFREDENPYQINPDNGALTDEAAAMAELLAVFIRIPSKPMRRKILNLLNEMF